MRDRLLTPRVFSTLVAMSLFLAACEDKGNNGDDNLLTGASLIVVIVVIAIVAWALMRRRGRT
jgi:hypothetical protein